MAVCTTILPTVRADDCTTGAYRGQIDGIYFTRFGDGLTLVTDPTEWATRLDQDDVLPDAPALADIRKLNVIGSWPAPEQTSAELSGNRTHFFDANHTINFAVDDTGQVNYDFAQDIAAVNGQQYSVWVTNGAWIFGGNAGIAATLNVTIDIPEGRQELRKIRGTLTWTGGLPDMAANPLD